MFAIDFHQRLRNMLSIFLTICSYGNCNHHYSDFAAALIDLCHKNVFGNVVHTKVSKTAVEYLKARMNSALVFFFLNQMTRQNALLELMQTKLLLLGCFFKRMPLDL